MCISLLLGLFTMGIYDLSYFGGRCGPGDRGLLALPGGAIGTRRGRPQRPCFIVAKPRFYTSNECMATSSAVQKSELQKGARANEAKWTQTLMATGWTALPSIILDKQHALGIDALDLNILLQLAKYWWKKDDLPYPSKETLATAIGVNPSTIRKRIKRMEEEGLIERIERHDTKGGQQSNWYSFDGLIEKMKPHAEEALSLRKKQREESTELKRKKKPHRPAKLKLVKSGPIVVAQI